MSVSVICELLGVPVADGDMFRAWTELDMAISAPQEEIVAARASLRGYLAELVVQRCTAPTDDLLGVLVTARDEQDRFSEPELVQFGATLLNAGYETTASQVANFVYTLLADRRHWEQLVDNPGLIPRAVEELLRYVPFILFSFPCVAVKPVELGRAADPGGRDRAGRGRVRQSRRVGLRPRRRARLLPRGHGPHRLRPRVHFCLGASLARQEFQIALETLTRRLPSLRLAITADEVPWGAGAC